MISDNDNTLTCPFTGVPKKTVALMMLFAGVVEIPCRIANGFLADRHIISSLSQFAICIFCAGFMSLLCAIFSGIAGKFTAYQ